MLAVTAAGVTGLTVVFKAALGRPRPPLVQAMAAEDGSALDPLPGEVRDRVIGPGRGGRGWRLR